MQHPQGELEFGAACDEPGCTVRFDTLIPLPEPLVGKTRDQISEADLDATSLIMRDHLLKAGWCFVGTDEGPLTYCPEHAKARLMDKLRSGETVEIRLRGTDKKSNG